METTLTRPPLNDLRIVGGNLALDFVNTRAGPRHAPADTEWLSSYEDFAAWSRHAGVGHPSAAPSETAPRPAAIAAFARVQACRDDMYEIFLALGDGSAPPDPALRRLHLAYIEALAQGQLTGGTEGCAWTWDPGSGLLAPLWPIVAAAVELLTHGTTRPLQPCHARRPPQRRATPRPPSLFHHQKKAGRPGGGQRGGGGKSSEPPPPPRAPPPP